MFDNILWDLLILALFGAAVYALLVLPRQREFRKRQKFIAALKVGLRVATYGGLIGTIRLIDYDQGIVHVEVAEGVILQVLAPAIMREFTPETAGEAARYIDREKPG
jgi:preprotein translocase YajC subunit